MKKWLAIPLAILFALTLLFPAQAQTPTPTATTTPDPSDKMDVFFYVFSTNHDTAVASGSIICETIEGQRYTFDAVGELDFRSADFTCLGELVWTVVGNYGGTFYTGGGLGAGVMADAPIYYDSDFQTNLASQIPYDNTAPDAWHLAELNGLGTAPGITNPISHGYGLFQGGHGQYLTWPNMSSTAVTTYLYIHDSLKPPCSSIYQTESVIAQGSISASSESGVSQTLVVGSEYRLTVSGGPWNDGTTDRYDVATRADSGSWTPLSSFITDGADCSQSDPLDPTKTIVVFPATDTAWAVRVNDVDGEFGDNTGSMDYKLELVETSVEISCSNQYLRGSWIASGVIPANLANGTHPNVAGLSAGTWIEIQTEGGPWRDGGAPPDRYDIQLKNLDGSWSELSGDSSVGCSTTSGNYIDAWVQLPTNSGIDLRVNDTGGIWSSNTGNVGYEIYATSFSPFAPGGCTSYYHIGDLIKTVTAQANNPNGADVGSLFAGADVTGGEEDTLAKNYIAIQTSGVWSSGPVPSAAGGLASGPYPPASSAWSPLQTYPTVACAYPLDPIGHVLVFIPVDSDTNYLNVRVQDYIDTSYANNTGTLAFSFYKASLLRPTPYVPGPMPDPGVCDSYYTKGTAGSTIHLYGNVSNWATLPVLTNGQIYAIETSAGPWTNNGANSYEVEISDGTSSWNLVNFAGAACAQSADGLHLLLYFKALSGRQYKVRVYDPGGNFTDNGGTINVLFYPNVVSHPPDWNNCSDNYSLTQLTVPDDHIPRNPAGVAIPGIDYGSGDYYAILINPTDYWYPLLHADQHHYEAQISTDNGSTWHAFDPTWSLAVCSMQVNQPVNDYEIQYKLYFQAPSSGTIKMRVSSDDSLYVLSAGQLSYTLYGATETNPPGPNPPINHPEWYAACYESFLRPNSLFKLSSFSLGTITFGSLGSVTFPTVSLPIPAIDDWISYLQWTVRSYFAWCPEHTAALAAIPTSLNSLEPFGTVHDVSNVLLDINTKIDQFDSSGGEGEGSQFLPYDIAFNAQGGESGSSSWSGLLPALDTSSPWLGGTVPLPSLNTGVTGGESGSVQVQGGSAIPYSEYISYVNYCKGISAPYLGAAGTGLCWALGLAKTAPKFWIIVQLIFDVMAILGAVKYIRVAWIDARAAG
jgi:hypothetical protein